MSMLCFGVGFFVCFVLNHEADFMVPLNWCLWQNETKIKTTWSISSNVNVATSHQFIFLQNVSIQESI